jgi:glycosyltransferase involved in cell wall biosynthesis
VLKQKTPVVTVIMPVRNEELAIRQSIASVLAQDHPAECIEVLVADGRSDDNTRQIVNEISREDSRVQLVDNPRKIMAAGFNAAVAVARGDMIMMLGGHAELASDYLRHSSRILQAGLADCVSGPITTICETPSMRPIALAMGSPFGVGDSAFRIGSNETKYVDTVAFGTFTREAIERAGLLDEELVRCQDCEYSHRLRKLGGKILLSPDLRSQYRSRTTLRALWRQYFQYGYWKVRVLQKHPRQMRPRHFVPAVFVSSLFVSLLAALAHPLGKWLFLFVAGSYVLANLAISLRLAGREKCNRVHMLAVSFAVLHLSYGSGFLLGLVKFWNRWGERDEWVGAGPRRTQDATENIG